MSTPQSTIAGTPTSSAGGHYLIPHTHSAGSLPRQEPYYDAINVRANGQLIALYNAASIPGGGTSPGVGPVTVSQAVQNNDNPGDEGAKQAAAFLAEGKITQQQYDTITKEIPPAGKGVAPVPITVAGKDAGAIAPPYSLTTVLTPGGTTLGDMINKVTFPRTVAQLSEGYPGMTPSQIVNNLAALALNIYEPLKKQYPKVLMTNSFRHGAAIGGGQHGTGQAADFQFRGVNSNAYFDIAVWMSKNLPYDQLLLEYLRGKTVWIHCSYAAPGLPNGGLSVRKSKGVGSTVATLNGAKGGKFVPNLHADIIANAGINKVVAA